MISTAILLAAKKEVSQLGERGMMISPREAWLLAGAKSRAETLWSVAYRIGTTNDESPEEIHAYLEKQFPMYSLTEGLSNGWDDHHSGNWPEWTRD